LNNILFLLCNTSKNSDLSGGFLMHTDNIEQKVKDEMHLLRVPIYPNVSSPR
jgi:hypothetical protein